MYEYVFDLYDSWGVWLPAVYMCGVGGAVAHGKMLLSLHATDHEKL